MSANSNSVIQPQAPPESWRGKATKGLNLEQVERSFVCAILHEKEKHRGTPCTYIRSSQCNYPRDPTQNNS